MVFPIDELFLLQHAVDLLIVYENKVTKKLLRGFSSYFSQKSGLLFSLSMRRACYNIL